MRKTDAGTIARGAAATLCAYLVLPAFPAQAHGMPGPGVILFLFGALIVHFATPIAFAVLDAFKGRRGRVFGIYAVTMCAYYALMWIFGSFAMFAFPVFPVALAALLYFLLGKVPENG